MRKVLSVVVGLSLGAYAAPVFADTQTVTGEVVSVWCYIQSKQNVGKAGYLCALADLKWEGNPPGVLTPDGNVYQLAGQVVADNNVEVVPHIGHTVTITGDVVEKNGVLMLTANDLTVVSK